MKNIFIAITLFSLITSCYDAEKPNKPENLLSKDKMVEVLLDVSLLNAAKGINKSILEKNGIVPDSYVYDKHNIDSLQFLNSNNYYTYYINDYQEIINKVNDSLKTLRTKYNVLYEKEKYEEKKLDSIKRSKRKNKGFIKEDIIPTKTLENN